MPLLPDEAGDVDVDEGGHEVLAVEPVHDAAVTRDGVGKILQQVQKKKEEKGKRKKSREVNGEVLDAECGRRCGFSSP